MDDSLKNSRPRAGWPLYVLAVLSASLAMYVGYITVDRYAPVVRAVLGVSVVVLLFIDFFVPHRSANQDGETHWVLPEVFKFVATIFLVAVILFWASVQVIQLAWWLRALGK